ncbi:uncharacterized protein E0L32_007270 [Thyridium curvatum]|uniref:DAGKc domain-containing protein n=1 Tax=Thyridium curvatum TaxID=1093900 RepID=A0A507AWW0_9PEZI|nr:uncharacterized protein E0L32_007270 [Thyridium curvatum]TPX11967.1 hypothetical protein E0L32_007270 [Thyridium curvatum]
MASAGPINPALIQEHVQVRQLHFIEHIDSELSFRDQDKSGGNAIVKVREEQIIFITKSGDGHILVALHDDPENRDRPFELSGVSSPELPQPVVDAHLLRDLPEGLKGSANHRLHVIISTRSGVGLAQSFYDGVVEPLLASLGLKPRTHSDNDLLATSAQDDSLAAADGCTYNLVVTQSSRTIKDFARDLWRRIPEVPAGQRHTILLLSGDGGVVDLLNGSREPPMPGTVQHHHHHPTIAIAPLGTGNALFHSLHKPHYSSGDGSKPPPPSHFALALRTLLRGAARPLPTFKAAFSPGARLITYAPPGAATADGNGTASTTTTNGDSNASDNKLEEHADAVDHLYGAIVASYGFHAQLIWESDTPDYRRHGDKRFAMVAGELLKSSHQYRAEVEVVLASSSGGDGGGGGGGKKTAVLLDGSGGTTTTTASNEAAANHHDDGDRGDGRGRFTYVLATMVSNLEKTFTISPASRPLDGRLRLVHFGGADGRQTMEIMKAAYQEGRHVGMAWSGGGEKRAVGYDEVDEVKITVGESDARWRKVCVDGVVVEVPEGGWMSLSKVARPSYRVLVA